MLNQVAQRSNQMTTGQLSNANDMPAGVLLYLNTRQFQQYTLQEWVLVVARQEE